MNRQIFYIGGGRPARPYDIMRRPQKWHAYVESHGGKLETNILEWFDDRNEASRREAELIEKHNPPCNQQRIDTKRYSDSCNSARITSVQLSKSLLAKLDSLSSEF